MKKFITPSYVFTPGATNVGSIILTGINSFDIEKLVSIINITQGAIIYNPVDPSLTYYSINDSTIVLKANTASHSSTDKLLILYEENDINDEILLYLNQLRFNQGRVDSSGRQVVYLEQVNSTMGAMPVNLFASAINVPIIHAAAHAVQMSAMGMANLYNQIIVT